MADFDPSLTFLFDNGSLRATSTLSLRRLARRLQDRLAGAVKPVSLLHSSGIDPVELAGQPAELLEPALQHFARAGGRSAVLLPLFFGPSAALTAYVPDRLRALQATHPLLELRLAEPLVSRQDDSAEVIAGELYQAIQLLDTGEPARARRVILVDHGSPQAAVTAVRDRIGLALARRLAGRVAGVVAASMERRAGPDYAFNEPLLETALKEALRDPATREIVVALQFLQAGRHAGPGGDIAQICAGALQGRPSVNLRLTPLLGETPAVLALLEKRWREAVAWASGSDDGGVDVIPSRD